MLDRGEGYFCPLCGRRDDRAFSLEHIGYPTCYVCNHWGRNELGLPWRYVLLPRGLVELPEFHGAWWTRNSFGLSEGEMPIDIRCRQLQVILAPSYTGLISRAVFDPLIISAIAKFLLPA